jgi:alpha-glucosidase
MSQPNSPWWRGTIGYEVYLRSFADGNGDGTGDLVGLRDRLPHLARLGIDVVWITPCYPSPGFDHGYDVADYLDIDATFGGLSALQEVVDDAHDLGLRVIMDLVPNHTSSHHPWFRDALTGRDAEHRDWYVWVDGTPDAPPNNWMSHFGGPAWTWDPTSEQWYLHRFLPEQPDLNWRNPAVAEAFDHILTTWFERGIDGFRIDVCQGLLFDAQLRDNPEPDPPVDWSQPRTAFGGIDHVHDLDQPDNVEVHRGFARVANAHDALLVGEVYLHDAERVAAYVDDGALRRAFWFPGLRTGWDATAIATTLRAGVTASRGRFAWVMSSHDDPRAATRFGGGALGRERQLAYLALLLALPGMPFLYQGDELGLDNGVLPADRASDPIATRNEGAIGRDGSRTPMPWAPGPHLGFTTAEPWLPVGTNRTDADTAAVQEGDPTSPLERTRALLHARRTLTTMLDTDDVTWLDDAPDHVVALRRGDVLVACNVGGPPTGIALPDGGDLVATSAPGVVVQDDTVVIPTDTTAWVQLP